MSVHLEQYRQEFQSKVDSYHRNPSPRREPVPVYDVSKERAATYHRFTRHFRDYAPIETVKELTREEALSLCDKIYPNATPFDYGEPPLFSEDSQETISRSSQKTQKLFEELVSFHKRYKECTYEFSLLSSVGRSEFRPTGAVRAKRQQLEASFSKLEERVRPVIFSKEQGFQYLLEKVCHIGTEMLCSIGQDSDFMEEYFAVFENEDFKYKSRDEVNQMQSEYTQLVARVAKIKELAQVLGRREFDLGNGRKCYFPQESIQKIESNLKEIRVPRSYAFQALGAAASGLSGFFNRKIEARREARRQARIKEHEAWQKENERMNRVRSDSFDSRMREIAKDRARSWDLHAAQMRLLGVRIY